MEQEITIISNGTVITEHAVLENHDVIIGNGKIIGIRPSTLAPATKRIQGYEGHNEITMLIDSAESIINGTSDDLYDLWDDCCVPRIIDAEGAYVAPGFIDIHSDYIETIASPRPTAVMDLRTSLYRAERELVGHGVTTMYHSLSVYKNLIFDHKPIRNFKNVSRLIDEISCMKAGEERDQLIRHRLHLRVELDAVNHYEAIKDYVESGSVDLISFMDHTPGQGQYADLDMFNKTLKGYRDLTDEDIAEIISLQQNSDKISLAQMIEVARIAQSQGLAVASHDDDSIEKLDKIAAYNPAVSEFPITMEVAREARRRGMHTLAGAPNVVMGHSHSGNLSAREAIKAGAIDILCSDYYPAALLGAVFALSQHCGVDLQDAFALVTINPAKATGIDDAYGSIEVGKQADLLIIRHAGENIPVVAQAFVGGRSVFESHYPVEGRQYKNGRQIVEQVRVER